MSTMRVTTLKNESSSVDQVVLNADGSFGGELASQLGSKLDLAGGKILQIVRATDATQRSTTNTSYVDANLSVTITPQVNTSEILLIASFGALMSRSSSGAMAGEFQITDASDNALSGAQGAEFTVKNGTEYSATLQLIARDTPSTINATTYKVRFRNQASDNTVFIRNTVSTAQFYAIEVSA